MNKKIVGMCLWLIVPMVSFCAERDDTLTVGNMFFHKNFSFNMALIYEESSCLDNKDHPFHSEAQDFLERLQKNIVSWRSDLSHIKENYMSWPKEIQLYVTKIEGLCEERICLAERFMSGLDRNVYVQEYELSSEVVHLLQRYGLLVERVQFKNGNAIQQYIHRELVDVLERAKYWHINDYETEEEQEILAKMVRDLFCYVYRIQAANVFLDLEAICECLDECVGALIYIELYMFRKVSLDETSEVASELRASLLNMGSRISYGFSIGEVVRDDYEASLERFKRGQVEFLRQEELKRQRANPQPLRQLTEEPSIWSYFWPF